MEGKEDRALDWEFHVYPMKELLFIYNIKVFQILRELSKDQVNIPLNPEEQNKINAC